jgi:cytochrome c-type biogenesis protein CcmH/NrfG
MERDVSTTPRDTIEATFQNARALEYLTLAGVLLLVGFGTWTRHCIQRAPVAALCIGAFVIAYAPISNLFSLNATIAEHWLYVPSAFLFLAVPASGALAWNRHALIAAGTAIAAWIALLGARTWLRQEDWRDQRTFIERTIAAGGNSPRMYMNLANVESNAGNQDRALALYREALTRAPKQPVIWLGFASVLARAHDFHGSREALTRAGDSPLLRAQSLLLTASLDQAEGIGDGAAPLREAARAEPADWLIRKRCIEQLGREHALETLSAFIAAHDFRAESWRMYGALLEQSGRTSEAIDAYRQAALRDVRDGESRASIARLRAN